MKQSIKDLILSLTQATNLVEKEKIQDLWSSYGTIKRYSLVGGEVQSVVVKYVDIEQGAKSEHAQGWKTSASHLRKLKSYNVEINWYQNWANRLRGGRLSQSCYVPKSYVAESKEDSGYFLMVLEDLDSSGFPKRKSSVSLREVKTCLKWLAHFHAAFLGCEPEGLWEVGTYWHLDTRKDELDALRDEDLRFSAHSIDEKLNSCKYKTIVHGDAKLANFCFSNDCKRVAAVDFQYAGGGCGMKDVIYFISSCLNENESEQFEQGLLDHYFDVLSIALSGVNKEVDVEALILEWRELYCVAWADFHRFIKGWSPGHWKINSYSEKLTKNVIESL